VTEGAAAIANDAAKNNGKIGSRKAAKAQRWKKQETN